jgi:hypothetical protein
MAHVRLQPVQRQDHPALPAQPLPQPGRIGQAQRHQLLVAAQQLGDAALGDVHAALAQGLVHLGHAALLPAAPVPDLRDDVQAKLALRQHPAAQFLWPIRLVVARTGWSVAASHP